MLYLEDIDGNIHATAYAENSKEAQQLYSHGWHKIPRAQYRKMKRERKNEFVRKHTPATDARATGESANESEVA